jgi:hypothetical protein
MSPEIDVDGKAVQFTRGPVCPPAPLLGTFLKTAGCGHVANLPWPLLKSLFLPRTQCSSFFGVDVLGGEHTALSKSVTRMDPTPFVVHWGAVSVAKLVRKTMCSEP